MSLSVFGASSAFAGSVNFGFGGPDTTLGTSASFTSNGVTITAFGYECTASAATSTATLSGCTASNLFAKSDGPNETGLGLAGEADHEIGFDPTSTGGLAAFTVGLDLSNLFNMGARSMTLSFGSVQPGEAFAVLGYGSNPFGSSSFALTNTKAWVGNPGVSAQVFSSGTFHLNTGDEFLVLVSPCGASSNPNGPCGSNVTLDTLSSATPEPGTLFLFATGLLGMMAWGMRRRLTAAFASARN